MNIEEYEVEENRIQLNKYLRLLQLSTDIEINEFNPTTNKTTSQ